MSKSLKFLFFVYMVLILSTGMFMIIIVNADEGSPAWVATLVRNHGIVFVWHLACWMILGMVSNYYWDLFNMGKGIESLQVERILLPLLVSPIVFFPTYNLWLSSNSQSYILFQVIAFQSGFFWQALFTKAKPLEGSASIPWSVSHGTSSRTSGSKTAASAGQTHDSVR
jgi:hypothetical protein